MELGADFLATGHYCQNKEGQLLKGADPEKDQSYFLYTIKKTILEKVMFPIGHLNKTEVRAMAKKYGLATSEKKDSTGVCFIGKRDFKEFLGKYIAAKPGNFETVDGKVVGTHDGCAYYTIGQRKGLGIGGPGEAWFVVDKDIPRNVVYIDQGAQHPAMFKDHLTASELTWVAEKPPFHLPYRCKAKIRYRQQDQDCTITSIDNGVAHVQFDIPQRAITPRQSIVFYDHDICLGGGIIN